MRAGATSTYRQWPKWVRGPARVEDGYVVADITRTEEYVIYRPKDLPFDLASLAPISGNFDARKVPSFVRRYGLLWHGPAQIEDGVASESLSDWQEAAEEASFIIEHYRVLRRAIETNSLAPVEHLVEAYSTSVNLSATNTEECLGQLSIVLADLVTERLGRCTLGLVAAAGLRIADDAPGRFMIAHHPRDLVSAAYAQLAVYVASQAEVRECPGCGIIFVPESGKQKYHSPSCANTARWRRWKDRQAEG
jgi:hypothetical protein